MSGIDVASYQGQLTPAALAPYQFALIKATQGTGYVNPDLAEQAAAVWNAGLYRGFYHFADPGASALAQVAFFLQAVAPLGIGQRRPDLFMLDLEVTGGRSPADVSAWALQFLEPLASITGSSPEVYTMPAFAAAGNCAGLGSYPLWIAGPGDKTAPVPAPWKLWTFWQQGTADGGRLGDLDVANTTSLLELWKRLGATVVKPPA